MKIQVLFVLMSLSLVHISYTTVFTVRNPFKDKPITFRITGKNCQEKLYTMVPGGQQIFSTDCPEFSIQMRTGENQTLLKTYEWGPIKNSPQEMKPVLMFDWTKNEPKLFIEDQKKQVEVPLK